MRGVSSGLRPAWAPALVCLVTAGVYWGSLNNPFHYDDGHSIVENPHVRSLGNLPAYLSRPEMFSADPKSAMYRPLVLATYAVNYAFSGYSPGSYHALNLLLHLGCALLVFLLLGHFGASRAAATAGMALFALHPVQAETVNYVSSRSESLCALFVLASLLAYGRAIEGSRAPASRPGLLQDRGGAGGASGGDPAWLLVSLAAFAAALLCKSVGIAVPALLAAYEVLGRGVRSRAGLRAAAVRQAPFWVVAAGYVLLTRGLVAAALLTHPVRGPGTQLLTQAKALVYYLLLLAMPAHLSVDHQFRLAGGLLEPTMLAALALLVSGGWLAWRGLLAGVVVRVGSGPALRPDEGASPAPPGQPPAPAAGACGGPSGDPPVGETRGTEETARTASVGAASRSVALWLAWPLLVLGPTLLVPLNVLVNEHRLYLPMVAVAGLAAMLWDRLRGSQGAPASSPAASAAAGPGTAPPGAGRGAWLVPAVGVAVCILFGALDGERTAVWQSPLSLWGSALARAPLMPRPHLYLGDQYAAGGDPGRALQEYRAALTVYPEVLSPADRLIAHNNSGAALLSQGRFVEAIEEYQRALAIDSTYARARESLEALLAVHQQANGSQADQWRKQGLVHLVSGDLGRAVAALRRSLQEKSDPQTWIALGLAYERLGDAQAALRTYEALRIAGRGTPYAQTAEDRIRQLRPRR
ncbi:MAG: tetratricopeptide repeat protein [Candidatus Latescibacterota bacterium]